MRPAHAHWYSSHDELNPIPRLWVNDEDLAIQIEQGVQRRVMLHLLSLSLNDKQSFRRSTGG